MPPPQTIISLPVHTADGLFRERLGWPAVLIAVHASVVGS